jgi:hypothetical protein
MAGSRIPADARACSTCACVLGIFILDFKKWNLHALASGATEALVCALCYAGSVCVNVCESARPPVFLRLSCLGGFGICIPDTKERLVQSSHASGATLASVCAPCPAGSYSNASGALHFENRDLFEIG